MRLLTTLGALAGAIALSQFPEFSQQYLQRLAGKVDALQAVGAAFDASAAAQGMTREAALSSLTGGFGAAHQADLRATFAEEARLSVDLDALRRAEPFWRMTMPWAMGDWATLQATWADYRPAVPTTQDGAVTAGVGFLGGHGLGAGLSRGLRRLFRRA